MMKSLKNLFTPKTPAEQPMPSEVAVAALLVEAALVDGVYVNIESDMIAEILLESFNFDADKADAVLAEAEARSTRSDKALREVRAGLRQLRDEMARP